MTICKSRKLTFPDEEDSDINLFITSVDNTRQTLPDNSETMPFQKLNYLAPKLNIDSETQKLIVDNGLITDAVTSKVASINQLSSDNINTTNNVRAKSINCELFDSKRLNAKKIIATQFNSKDISGENITVDNLSVKSTLDAPKIKSAEIIGGENLVLGCGIDKNVIVPNIKYGIMFNQSGIILPAEIKAFRVFIISTATIVQSDSQCDGMEIVVYNNSNAVSILRDYRNIIIELKPSATVKIIFLSIIGKWIVI